MRWSEVWANYGATLVVIAAGIWFYTYASTFHRGFLVSRLVLTTSEGMVSIRTTELLLWLGGFYAVILLPYYALLPGTVSKARIAFAWVLGQFFAAQRPSFGREQQQAFLALALKLFFVPLMLNWMLQLTVDVLGHWQGIGSSQGMSFLGAFNTNFYLLAFKTLLFIDVLLFSVGYLIEIPALRNEILTVDPTVSGWVVCLACYPPFNNAVTAFFPWYSSDFPKFSDPAVHVALNCAILASMAIYASASVALGLRASNLTNRGIVARGPYAWVRHPAYVAKNLAWWIGAFPAIWIAFSQSTGAGIWAVVSVATWTLIYALRALTEERHLLMLNNGYAEYMTKVRWRFIPKVC